MQKSIFWLTIILLAFGLIILSSAGVVDGQKKFGSSYYYLNHQLLYGVLPGLALMFIFSRIDYKFWRKVSILGLFGALVLMVLVFVPDFGLGLKGANRWVTIAGFSFQPSEILKLSMVIYLAAWFGGRDSRIKNWAYGAAPFFIVLAFVGLLLVLQPDVGTLVIVTFISVAVYFFAGAEIKHMALIGLVALLALGAVVAVEPYRLNRIKTFWDPTYDPKGVSYQVNQSLIAIGSGGVKGVGFGKSTQKFGFLPEVANDSIFAVVVEELGFAGGTVLVTLFVALSGLLVLTAMRIGDKFGQLLIMGMATWIISQAIINISAVSGLMPLTGVPLPFVSYGGTALAILLAGMGIVLNVAKKA